MKTLHCSHGVVDKALHLESEEWGLSSVNIFSQLCSGQRALGISELLVSSWVEEAS